MSTLAGLGGLVRLLPRRDRLLLPLWILLLGTYPALLVVSKERQFPTAAARAGFAHSVAGNPGSLVFNGPVYGSSPGAAVAWDAAIVFWALGLVSLLVVVRHTRAEEEAGRRELLGATVVGRNAPLAAALLVTLAADLVLALAAMFGLLAQGLPAGGSLALGLGLAAVGWVCAALAAVAAQLTRSAPSARSLHTGRAAPRAEGRRQVPAARFSDGRWTT